MSSISDRISQVVQAIDRAAAKGGRAGREITLVAVSKKQSLESMNEYAEVARAAGIPLIFGENYLQELTSKRASFGSSAEFHLIGPLQSNKIRDAVKLADVIESAHSIKTLELIAKEARAIGKRQRVFIQVNIGADPKKSGFSEARLKDAFNIVSQNEDALALEGLMTITPFYDDPREARKDFRAMSELRAQLANTDAKRLFYGDKIVLSMGMSADFDIAIEEGADLVRVGTALFGNR
jgi:pyridoxal phosphate enzyme (YggS family)